jgi:Natural resistance-associated macrophage protein/GAF domain
MILPTMSRWTPSIASSLPSRRPARRVGTLVARGVEPSEVGGAVAEELRRCLGAITAGLWRFETSGEITLVAAAANPAALARWPVGTRTPIEGDTLATVVQRTGLPARIDSYETIPGSVAARVRAVGVRAAVGVPIIVDGSVWGLAAVGSQEPGPMPADTETRISRFAELIATALVAGPLSTSYAVADAVGAPRSVSAKLRQAPVFYGIFTLQIVVGAVVALAPGNLVALVVNAQVLNGVITPLLLTYILILANRSTVLGTAKNGPIFKAVAAVCVAVVGVLSFVVLVQTVFGRGLGLWRQPSSRRRSERNCLGNTASKRADPIVCGWNSRERRVLVVTSDGVWWCPQ